MKRKIELDIFEDDDDDVIICEKIIKRRKGEKKQHRIFQTNILEKTLFEFLDQKTYVKYHLTCKKIYDNYKKRKNDWLLHFHENVESVPSTRSIILDAPMIRSKLFSAILNKRNILLHGPAGTGKTTIIKELDKFFREQKIAASFTSTTHQSAIHTSGMTIHSLFGIGIQNTVMLFGSKNDIHKRDYLNQIDYIVIDEVSMLSDKVLETIHHVACYSRNNSLEPFGGIKLIIVGDFMQLPPVMSSPCFISPIFQFAEFLPITTYIPYRQNSQLSFFCLLQRLRVGSPNENDINKLKQLNDKKLETKNVELPMDIIHQHNIMVSCSGLSNEYLKDLLNEAKTRKILSFQEYQNMLELYLNLDRYIDKEPKQEVLLNRTIITIDDEEEEEDDDKQSFLTKVYFSDRDIRILRMLLILYFIEHDRNFYMNEGNFFLLYYPILVAKNEQQHEINNRIISKLPDHNKYIWNARDEIINMNNGNIIIIDDEKETSGALKTFDNNVPRQIILKPGVQYRITKSIFMSEIKNGQICIYLGYYNNQHYFVTTEIEKKIIFTNNDILETHVGYLSRTKKIYRRQLCLRLGYATTIHSSQGATMKAGMIEFGTNWNPANGCYVALSRMQNLQHLILKNFNEKTIRIDKKALEFVKYVELNNTIPIYEVDRKEKLKKVNLYLPINSEHPTLFHIDEKKCQEFLKTCKQDLLNLPNISKEEKNLIRKKIYYNFDHLLISVIDFRIDKNLYHSSTTKEIWCNAYNDILLKTREEWKIFKKYPNITEFVI